MDALNLLKRQHREVEKMFREAKRADGNEKERIFIHIADALALHATIEEKRFYPSVMSNRTHDELLEALQEHLQMKRLLADMLDMDPDDERFDAKLTVLEEETKHHIEEEENKMFVWIQKEFPKEMLEALGDEMEQMINELQGTEPRQNIPMEIQEAPSIM